MSYRARLLFPYVCALFVLALVFGDRVLWAGAGTAPPPSCHEAVISAGPTIGELGGLPVPLYYGSIALVLLISFVVIERRAKADAPPVRPTFDLLTVPGVRADRYPSGNAPSVSAVDGRFLHRNHCRRPVRQSAAE